MTFLIVEERGQVRHVPFTGTKMSIGRGPDNDIILTDGKSSRNHAVVEQDTEGYRVLDLNSLNGSFINGLRIREQRLNFGTTFTIGAAKITLETEQATAIDTEFSIPNVRRDARSATSGDSASSRTTADASRETAKDLQNDTDFGATTIVTPEDIDGDEVSTRHSDTQIFQALKAFDRIEIFRDVDRLLDALLDFVSAFVPDVRICLAETDAGKLRPLSFKNFITKQPIDELPRDFQPNGLRVVNTGKPIHLRIEDQPERMYIPFEMPGTEKGLVLFEGESNSRHFDPVDLKFMEAAVAPIKAITSIKDVIKQNATLKQTLSRQESELNATREELQKRLDMQTAELTRSGVDGSKISLQPQYRYDYSGIIGRSRPMHELFKLLDKVTDLPVPVLVIGEPGTGKELIARALHFNSWREEKGEFVAENCAAIPDSLIESELFGHVKGAFTGADRDKKGLFERANGGSIFLDEIGEMDLAPQAKLLRVLEEGEIRPVGGDSVKKVDFRLIAATNRPLDDWVKDGRFRQDLYYRINVFTIRVPPLRERREDIPVLVEFFLEHAAEESGREKLRCASGVMRALMEYHWPGNVRELENEINKMVALAEGDKITIDLLSAKIKGGEDPAEAAGEDIPLKELVEKIEKRRIQEVLKRSKGNKSRAAEILGLSRLGLRKKMERYKIEYEG